QMAYCMDIEWIRSLVLDEHADRNSTRSIILVPHSRRNRLAANCLIVNVKRSLEYFAVNGLRVHFGRIDLDYFERLVLGILVFLGEGNQNAIDFTPIRVVPDQSAAPKTDLGFAQQAVRLFKPKQNRDSALRRYIPNRLGYLAI